MEKREGCSGAPILLTLVLTVLTSSVGTAGGAPLAPAVGGGVGCIGDCNGDGRVTVDEIITAVNIALGNVDAVCL